MLKVRPDLLPASGLSPLQRGGLSRTLTRLSEGVRIHEAADDAAGLGVATSLHTDTRSMAQALRNINDGLHAIHTAEGGLVEMRDMIQRLRELAVASASETLHDDERAYLEDEVSEVLEEVDRVAATTRYGDESLLSRAAVDIMLIADVSNSMAAELPVIATELVNLRDRLVTEGIAVRTGVAQASTNAAGGDPIDGSETLTPLDDDVAATDAALAALSTTGVGSMDPYTVLLDQAGLAPVTGTNGPEDNPFGGPTVQKVLIYASDTGREVALTPVTETDAASQLSEAGFRVYATTVLPTHAAVFDEITAATGGSTEHLDPAAANVVTLMTAIGDDIIAQAGRTQPFSVQAGIHDSGNDRIELGIPADLSTASMGIAGVSVATVDDAREAIDLLDAALKDIGRATATMGAAYNRLEAAYDNLTVTREALSAGESRIRDADMAELTSQSVAEQIQSQAAVAARAQANQLHAQAIPALLG